MGGVHCIMHGHTLNVCTRYPHIIHQSAICFSHIHRHVRLPSVAICKAQSPRPSIHLWLRPQGPVRQAEGPAISRSRARPNVGICRFLQHRHLAAAGIRLAFCCWLHVSAIPLLLFAQLRAFAFTLSLQIGQGAKIHYPATLRLDFVDVVQCCTYNLYRNLAMN